MTLPPEPITPEYVRHLVENTTPGYWSVIGLSHDRTGEMHVSPEGVPRGVVNRADLRERTNNQHLASRARDIAAWGLAEHEEADRLRLRIAELEGFRPQAKTPVEYHEVVTRYGEKRHLARLPTLPMESRHFTLCLGTSAWTIENWSKGEPHPQGLTPADMNNLPLCASCERTRG